MKNKWRWACFYVAFFSFFSLSKVFGQTLYFDHYQKTADSLEAIYGIPSSVILAVGFHESGAGKSTVAVLLNNHFGIKGSNQLYQTHKIKSAYKYYANVHESYTAFCGILSRKGYYERLKGTTNTKDWVKAIASMGYAADPNKWADSIMDMISEFDLN